MSLSNRRIRASDTEGRKRFRVLLLQDSTVSSTSADLNSTIHLRRWRPENNILIPNRSAQQNSQTSVPQISQGMSTTKSMIIVALIFISSLLLLATLYKHFPKLDEKEKQHIKLPWDLEDAKQLGLVLDRYKDKYFYEVLFGVFLVYIFSISLQTFAIPGSIFLSILSGFLFPFYLALILVCCCSAIGASLCFFLSNILGKKLVKKFFPERAAQWSKAVEKHKNNLLNYIIFLRVTPFLPNWFINMSAPVIGVPLVPFALGTFIGVAPPSFVAIQAGQTLHTLTSTSDAWSWTSVTILSLFALVSLVPVLLKQRLREKFE